MIKKLLAAGQTICPLDFGGVLCSAAEAVFELLIPAGDE